MKVAKVTIILVLSIFTLFQTPLFAGSSNSKLYGTKFFNESYFITFIAESSESNKKEISLSIANSDFSFEFLDESVFSFAGNLMSNKNDIYNLQFKLTVRSKINKSKDDKGNWFTEEWVGSTVLKLNEQNTLVKKGNITYSILISKKQKN